MIIARSPLRISLGGGGTDLPSYYREHGGFLIAGAIDKYVYVTVMRPFVEGIFLKYSKLEHVDRIDQVERPAIVGVGDVRRSVGAWDRDEARVVERRGLPDVARPAADVAGRREPPSRS